MEKKQYFKTILALSCSNIWRNKFLSCATITVIALILFSFNIILTINATSESIIEKLNTKVDVILYLRDDIQSGDREKLLEELKNLPSIQQLQFTSKEEALKNFLSQYQEENPFTKYGLENTLPANIQIITESPQDHSNIISYLRSSQYKEMFETIESDKESQEIASKLLSVTLVTQKIMWGVIIAFIIGGILIILNSISLTMYSRKEEIQIMRLVGADYDFIRLPFVIEGAIYGITAVILSILLLIIFTKSFDVGTSVLGDILSLTKMTKTLAMETIMSVLIGIMSSQIAIHRYFSEK